MPQFGLHMALAEPLALELWDWERNEELEEEEDKMRTGMKRKRPGCVAANINRRHFGKERSDWSNPYTLKPVDSYSSDVIHVFLWKTPDGE